MSKISLVGQRMDIFEKFAVVGHSKQPLVVYGKDNLPLCETEEPPHGSSSKGSSTSVVCLPGTGGWMAVGGKYMDCIKLYSLKKKQKEEKIAFSSDERCLKFRGYVKALCASRTRLLSAGPDHVCLWDTRNLDDVVPIWKIDEEHTKLINDAILMNNEQIISCSTDKTIRMFDCGRRKQVVKIQGHTKGVNMMRLAKDRGILFSVSNDNTCRMFSLNNKLKEVGRGESPRDGSSIFSVEYFPSRNLIVCGDAIHNDIFAFDIRKLSSWGKRMDCVWKLSLGDREFMTDGVFQIRKNSDGFIVGCGDRCVRYLTFGREHNEPKVRQVYEINQRRNIISGLCVVDEEEYANYKTTDEMELERRMKDEFQEQERVLTRKFQTDLDERVGQRVQDRDRIMTNIEVRKRLKVRLGLGARFNHDRKTRRIEKIMRGYIENDLVYNLDISRFYREKLFLPFYMKINKTDLYDNGIWRDFESYVHIPQLLSQGMVSPDRETLVCSLRQDSVLQSFVKTMKTEELESRVRSIEKLLLSSDKKKKEEGYSAMKQILVTLTHEICKFFGGLNNTAMIHKCMRFCKSEMREKESSKILLGSFKGNGVCRHRSLLFKLLCDELCIGCRIIRGVFFRYGGEDRLEYHAWNQVRVGSRFFLVDCSFGVGVLERERINALPETLLPLPEAVIEDDVDSMRQYGRYVPHYGERFASGDGEDGGKVFFGGGRMRKEMEKAYEKTRRIIDTDRGTVYSFKWEGKMYCVKEVKIDGKEERRDATRELMFLRFMNHECVIPFYTTFEKRDKVGEWTESIYTKLCIVMKLMQGNMINFKDVSTEWDKNVRLVETLIVFFHLARGLLYLSKNEIVHLDLKPGNVLVNLDFESCEVTEVRICDFGLSKATPGNRTLHRSALSRVPDNDVRYVAPEVVEKKKASTASDVYSFGKMMMDYEEEFSGYSQLINLAKKCQNQETKLRPSLKEILAVIRDHLTYLDLMEEERERERDGGTHKRKKKKKKKQKKRIVKKKDGEEYVGDVKKIIFELDKFDLGIKFLSGFSFFVRGFDYNIRISELKKIIIQTAIKKNENVEEEKDKIVIDPNYSIILYFQNVELLDELTIQDYRLGRDSQLAAEWKK